MAALSCKQGESLCFGPEEVKGREAWGMGTFAQKQKQKPVSDAHAFLYLESNIPWSFYIRWSLSQPLPAPQLQAG